MTFLVTFGSFLTTLKDCLPEWIEGEWGWKSLVTSK